jgi:hypothetical protein
MTTLEKFFILIILLSSIILIGVFSSILLILLPFVIQPILLRMYAQKIQHRIGIIWGLFALGMDIGIVVFFEMHLTAQLISDAIAEIGTAITMSTAVILIIFVIFQQDTLHTSAEDFPIRLRRGVFRIWISLTIPWIIFCAIQFDQNIYFFLNKYAVPHYFQIGKYFVGIPALAFVIGLAACWVIGGFRRLKPQNPTEIARRVTTALDPPNMGQ